MDYIDTELRQDLVDDGLISCLDRIEGFLYCADRSNTNDQQPGENAYTELLALSQGDVEFGFNTISRRVRNADPHRYGRIMTAIEDGRHRYVRISSDVFGHLASLIDTYQADMR